MLSGVAPTPSNYEKQSAPAYFENHPLQKGTLLPPPPRLWPHERMDRLLISMACLPCFGWVVLLPTTT